MTRPAGAASGAGRQLLLGASLAFVVLLTVVAYQVTFPLIGMAAVPLSVLLLLGQPATRMGHVLAGIALGVAALWLTQGTGPPGYILRAATVWATAMFLILTYTTQFSVTGRGLLALGTTAVVVSGLLPVVRLSWGELSWWAEHQVGMTARATMGSFWMGVDITGGAGSARPDDVAHLLQESVRLFGRIFPALSALAVLGALMAAAAVYYRLARDPRGTPPRPFRVFGFSDHLGWLAIPPLLFLLIPRFAILKPLAANVLLVLATLYGLRGVAVAVFFLPQALGGGFLLWLLLGTIILLVLPAVVGSAIALGLLDVGLQFRTRWTKVRSS
jgi:hypothetical protein